LDRKHYNPMAIAAVRQASREGCLIDVATDRDFISIILHNLPERVVVEETGVKVEFKPTARLDAVTSKPIQSVRPVQTEQTNTTSLVDDDFVVKLYRKLENGINPEIEVGRFLTDLAGFSNTPALL